MQPDSNLEIVRFLDSVRGLYPGGVPRSLLERPRAPVVKPQSRAVLEIVVAGDDLDSASDPYFGAKGELLRGIITQGLKLKVSDAHLNIVDASAAPKLGSPTSPIIIFGLPKFAVESSEARTVIRAGTLTDILNSKEAKRIFWNQLKSLVGLK